MAERGLEAQVVRRGMDVRYLIAVVMTAFIGVLSFAQTQPTRPSAYPTVPTLPSSFATSPLSPCYPSSRDRQLLGDYQSLGGRRRGYFDPSSPCYSGTIYPSYSAVPPFEFPRSRNLKPYLQGANSLGETQAQQRIEGKGYSKVSGLQKDSRGIWRGDATLKDGRRVQVILDLEGNIYSELIPPVNIWIRPLGN